MVKQSILTNKKILWGSAGVLLTSGVIAGVLVPVLTSKDDTKEKDTKLTLSKEVLNAKSSDDTITAMQKFYGLEIKKASAINELESGELKSKYQSASNLATFIFANKNTYQTLFVLGKQQTTNLQEVVMIMTPKNQVREQNITGKWPANQVNDKDQFNFLITFFKGKVVKVTKLNAKTTVANATKIFFKVKTYDLVNLFYQFKNADTQASNFGYYNAYLDDENNTQGLDLFKKYLLTLKAKDSTFVASDLTEVEFTKKGHNLETNTATVELQFSYQGLLTTKTISDFQYKVAYKLTLKAGVENKMADEVKIADIESTNLPSDVNISGVKPSTENTDGSVIKITFSGGTIRSQELPGLISYQSNAQRLLENTQSSDFTITGQSQILPSAYNDKVALRNQLKAKANSVANNIAKTKVKAILETVTITLTANDQTGILSFTIAIGKVNKTFTNSSFDQFNSVYQVDKRIDDEVARKTKPTIKPGSEWKSGTQISKEDIEIIPSDNSLISKIKNVAVKAGLPHWSSLSIVTVTIEVSSSIERTKKMIYKSELDGFVSVSSRDFFGYFSGELYPGNGLDLTNDDFVINNKSSILPSQFRNKDLIKNLFKNEKSINKLGSFLGSSNNEVNTYKKSVDNNMKITFNPNDQTGELQFTVWLGHKKTFTITGFKSTS